MMSEEDKNRGMEHDSEEHNYDDMVIGIDKEDKDE